MQIETLKDVLHSGISPTPQPVFIPLCGQEYG